MLESSLYTFLAAETNITAIVGTRIYPHFRDQESALPAVSFRTISKPHVHNLSGSAGCSRARVQIDSWASDLATCLNLAEQIRLSLQGFRGNMSGTTIGSCLLDNEAHLHERNAGEQFGTFHIASDFLLIFDEEIPA